MENTNQWQDWLVVFGYLGITLLITWQILLRK